jgi:YspA, cpYpsA-related SLOG family
MRTIIAGSRTITDAKLVLEKGGLLDAAVAESGFKITSVVCGLADGMDMLGWYYALFKNLPVAEFPADWAKHGKAAGPIRNEEMAKNADALILIWDGKSRGSANMLATAQKHGLKIFNHIIE